MAKRPVSPSDSDSRSRSRSRSRSASSSYSDSDSASASDSDRSRSPPPKKRSALPHSPAQHPPALRLRHVHFTRAASFGAPPFGQE